MAIDPKQYLADLLAEAGASDDQKQAILAIAANEKFSKRLTDDLMRHDDYSRSMDAVRKDKETVEADKRKAADYWQAESARTTKNQQIVDNLAATVKSYETKYGSLDGEPLTVTGPTEGMISRKDFDAELQKRDNTYVSLLQQGLKLVGQHLHEFKEPLDTDALAKTAIEKNLSLSQAYSELVEPRRKEAQATKYAADLKAAEEKGARDFASTHKIPVDTKPREAHLIFDKPPDGLPTDKLGQNRFARDSFVSAFNEAAATSGGS